MTMISRAMPAALLTAFALAAPVAAQNRAQQDTSLASMIAAERAFSKHSTERGTQSAFLTYMAPNSMLYRPKVVNAHAWLKARPMPPTMMLIWEPVFADVSRTGDLGFTTGPWLSQRKDQPQADPTFGEYLTVWRRQRDGSWKAEIDAGVAHGADPVGPGAVRTPSAPAYRGAIVPANTAKRALLNADSALSKLSQSQGAATAFLQQRHTDLRLLRNGHMPLTADSAIAHLRSAQQYIWKPVGGGVSAAADFGYTFGVYGISSAPGRVSESGDYLRIWRRDSAGVWRVLVDLTSPAS